MYGQLLDNECTLRDFQRKSNPYLGWDEEYIDLLPRSVNSDGGS